MEGGGTCRPATPQSIQNYRLSVQSFKLGPPSPASECGSPLDPKRGCDDWTESLALYIYSVRHTPAKYATYILL
jgi:hypothetical protein